MATAAILDFVNRFLGPSRRGTDGLKCTLKFCVDLIYSVEDIAVSIFITFGLKLPNHAHFLGVLGGFGTLNNVFCHRNPKRHILGWIRVVWRIDRIYPSTRFCWGDDKKKRWGKGREGRYIHSHKLVIFHLFGEQTPLDRSPRKFARL